MSLDPRLSAILACPKDHGFLYDLGESLYNPRLHLSYPVRDGIPVMLISEADELSEAEHEALMARIERDDIPKTLSVG